jgi:hypothetical protein
MAGTVQAQHFVNLLIPRQGVESPGVYAQQNPGQGRRGVRIIVWSTHHDGRAAEPAVSARVVEEKWQGSPHLAFADGAGRVWKCWSLPKASVRARFDAAVIDDRVHLRSIAVLQVRVSLLPISPADYGDLFHKRC